VRILGLDVGERRIGTAICDPDERVAVPLRVIERQGRQAGVQSVLALAAQEEVDALVVGLPLSLDGSKGPQARRTEAFARQLSARTSLPVELWDERLSTVEAERYAAARPRRRGRRGTSDALTAAIILQSFLDARRARAGES
jgi:putative Holliday junction resolvase